MAQPTNDQSDQSEQPTATNWATDTAQYLKKFATLTEQVDQQIDQFGINQESQQQLQGRLFSNNNNNNNNNNNFINADESKTNNNNNNDTIPTTTTTTTATTKEEAKEMEDELNTLNFESLEVTSNGNKTGINPSTQGDISIHHKNEEVKQDHYKSQRYIDFASMKNILRAELLDGCDKLNFLHPSKIQAEAIPRCLTNTSSLSYPNLIGQAHHGSGKTATFALIMLQRIDEFDNHLQGLVVVHSRELATQTYNVCSSLGQFIGGLKIALGLKGAPVPTPWDCQILIGTPGTIIDKYFNYQRRSEFGIKGFLKSFKILIVDEADEFLKAESKNKTDNKFKRGRGGMGGSGSNFGNLFDQLKMITNDITNNVSPFQTLLFSATYPATVKKLALDIAPDPFVIKVAQKQVQLDNIRVFKLECDDELDKFNTLLRIISLANVGQMIIFVNTVNKAKQLIEGLEGKNLGIACSALYGRGMDIDLRDKTMEQFRKNQTQCLVASNVIARGIDVPAVGLVVNFEIPVNQGFSEETGKTGLTFDSETFMHRVGRTGRFGAKGVCINLVSKIDSIGNDRLDAIQKEYSLDIQLLNNTSKDVKDSIASWLDDTV